MQCVNLLDSKSKEYLLFNLNEDPKIELKCQLSTAYRCRE